MDFKEVKAKTILTRCGIPGIDYVVNPYIGCRFACKYCYASFMGRFVGKTIQDWGDYVYAKINAPELLAKEIKKLRDKGKDKEIFFSSVTDPYQGAEGQYKLTRRCLEVLADYGFAGVVSFLTKSDLVLRDVDVFKKLKNAAVGMTVTSTDDGISRYFEKNAPGVSHRLGALKKLNENKIKTYAFIGPLLPHFVAQGEELEKLFFALSKTGTKDIFVEHLNLAKYIRNRLFEEMKGVDQTVLQKFYSSQSKDYRQELEAKVKRLIGKYKMHLLKDMVIFHKDFQKLKK
ncbi:radical SAM protein [Patescibacteria group bacterium]|nr:radical SAM protein [Patescibacteria group bacterium]